MLDTNRDRMRLDPWSAPAWRVDREPDGVGGQVSVLTLFLVGAECRYRCTMCDMKKHTLIGPTPRGSIPHQIRIGIDQWRDSIGQVDQSIATSESTRYWLKLYNASNFFDHRAIPFEDLPEIGRLVSNFERVIVENHPRLTLSNWDAFIEPFAKNHLSGKLEIAMGLESTSEHVLQSIAKGACLDDFCRAIETCRSKGIDSRAFLLFDPPFLQPDQWESSLWDSIEWSIERGVRHISVIPLRPLEDHPGSSQDRREPTNMAIAELRDALPTLETSTTRYQRMLTWLRSWPEQKSLWEKWQECYKKLSPNAFPGTGPVFEFDTWGIVGETPHVRELVAYATYGNANQTWCQRIMR
jgi:radical SAM enzyme (TIGR01210 family)